MRLWQDREKEVSKGRLFLRTHFQLPGGQGVATVWLSCTYLLVTRKSTNTIIAGSEQGFGFISDNVN
jgi:hypothetical protein